jgi:hypothetical protein
MSPPLDGPRAELQPLVEQFLATYPEIPQRVLDAVALVHAGRIELFRSGDTVGAIIAETSLEGAPPSYRILQPDHCGCAEAHTSPSHKCVHLLAVEMVDAFAQHAATAPAAAAPVRRARVPRAPVTISAHLGRSLPCFYR